MTQQKQNLRDSKNQRGQVSLEFIVVVGAVLVMVIAVYPYVYQQIELNKALTAARDGAEYGASMRGMGFVYEGGRKVPEGMIKLKSIRYNVTDIVLNETGKRRVDVFIDARLPSYIKGYDKKSVGCTIQIQTRKYIYRVFRGDWPAPGDMNLCPGPYLNETSGSYYTFNVTYPKWV